MDAATRTLLEKPWFADGLAQLERELSLPGKELRKRAEACLEEMWTTYHPVAAGAWRRFGALLTDRYDLVLNDERLRQINALDGGHSLIFLFSHRSYLDIWLLREAIRRAGIDQALGLAGANLNFFPMGSVLRRTGALFIRRSMKDDAVYRFVLRAYLAHILERRENLGWSIEGGRTRTGKLRPPRYGALRYVVDAVRRGHGPEAYLLPVSVVYDQLGEVANMTAEALGESKKPEDIGWLMRFALMQRNQGGTARIDIGEAIPLRQRIAELEKDPRARDLMTERIALAVCHRINQVTPATPTAVVTLALLAAERALTHRETVEVVEPILRYIVEHPNLPLAMARELQDLDWVKTTLEQLVDSGVLGRVDGGVEPVYYIAPQQHLVAAFYRNTLIHFLVVRAIGEFAMFLEQDKDGDIRPQIWQNALDLRELLKFEFFFAERRDFQRELLTELVVVDPTWDASVDADGRYSRPIYGDQVKRWFELARPPLAHLVLRPFLDAYWVFASELARWPEAQEVDDKELLRRCLGVGKQFVLQRRLHSEESVTLELFKNALSLAKHRKLLPGTGAELGAERQAFAQRLGMLVKQLAKLAPAEAS